MTTRTAKASASIRRIWSEFVPYSVLRSPDVLRLLQHRGLQVLVAVTPSRIEELGELSAVYRDAGIDLGVWPMVDDTDGRWGSTFNAQLYSDFVLRVADAAQERTTVAIDLEPPIALLRALLSGNPLSIRRMARLGNRSSGLRILQALTTRLGERQSPTLGAVHPILLADGHGESAWQWLLGTPVDKMHFDAVSPMAYTSLIEGYSRGVLPRNSASALLAQTARAARQRWDDRASLSLGSVGVGALGDERPYRNVTELAHDVALARACGVDDLALFDLGGALQKPRPEAWLDAFVHTPPAGRVIRHPLRTRLLESSLRRTGKGITLYRRWNSRSR
jgi:hypothetical protein